MTPVAPLFARFCRLAGRLGRCRRAASAVEFALVAPLFLALVFGIVVFGSYLAAVHGVQQLAAEAARSSVAGLSDGERQTLAAQYVAANAGSYPLIAPDHLAVSAATSANAERVFVVTVAYDASRMFIFALPRFVPAPPSRIVRQAAIPFGGY
jgi:Flp pilus assembly protein TadG